MAKIKITDSTFCDAASTLVGGRLKNDMILPIIEQLDGIGLAAVEAFGGATFEACLTSVFEDPWKRLKLIREKLKKTPLQMSFYGQNALGNKNFPDDTVEYFVKRAIDNGVDRLRVTDPLNDLRNIESTLRAVSRTNAKVIAGIAYTPGSCFNSDVFILYAKQLEAMGASEISIQDDAGALRPYDAYQLVKSLKGALLPSTPIHLHTHCKAGMGMSTALKAAEAGIDSIDAALAPFAMGASLPSAEALVAIFDRTPYSTDLDPDSFLAANEKMSLLRAYCDNNHMIPTETMTTDMQNIKHLIPGNLTVFLADILRDAKIENRYNDVATEIARIREECGNPPLLTPVGEIIIAQAVLNTIEDKRYAMLTREFKALVRGEYGRTPIEISPSFRNAITGSTEGIDYRPADRMEPLIEKLRESIAPYTEHEDDILTYAIFRKKALDFFEARRIKIYGHDENADYENKVHVVQ